MISQTIDTVDEVDDVMQLMIGGTAKDIYMHGVISSMRRKSACVCLTLY